MVRNLEVFESVKSNNYWSEDEVRILKKFYQSTEVEKIAQLVGRSKDAVWSKVAKMDLKRIDSKLIQPNLVPSETLCYILGVLKGDGSVYADKHGHYCVRLQVKDILFAESFEKALSKIGLHPNYRYMESEKRPPHIVIAYSKKMANWYSGLTLDNIASFLVNVTFGISFIRGFYESEGSFTHTWRQKRKQHQWKLALYNSNEPLLRMVHDILKELGFNFHWQKPRLHKPHMFRGRLIVIRKPVCYIQTQSKYEILDFLSLIHPCIKGNVNKIINIKNGD